MKKTIAIVGLAILILTFLGCGKEMEKDAQAKPDRELTDKLAAAQSITPISCTLISSKIINGKNLSTSLHADYIYTTQKLNFTNLEISLGGDYNDKIIKITLKKGYQLVVAENSDGTGHSGFFTALTGTRTIDFTKGGEAVLKNKISYIRTLPIDNPSKKGVAAGWSRAGQLIYLLSSTSNWLYNWTAQRHLFFEITPMHFGKKSIESLDTIKLLINKKYATLMGFNEPDNTFEGGGSQMTEDVALNAYTNSYVQYTGMRRGLPVVKQGNWKDNKWLGNFWNKAHDKKIRFDFVALHWYDWSNYKENDGTPEKIKAAVNRLKMDIDGAKEKYGKPVWLTEFNANKNIGTAIQIEFMKAAVVMLEDNPNVERYSWFWEKDSMEPIYWDNNIGRWKFTRLGQTWIDLSSAKKSMTTDKTQIR